MNIDTNTKHRVCKDVRREGPGRWSVNVWWGSGYVTDVRRYYYRTREHARHADISHNIGKNGRIT